MQTGIYVYFRRLRKAQICGTLGTDQIFLHYALGEPMFVELEVLREGRLLQDVKVGSRVHLDSTCPSGSGFRDHYRSDKIVAIEGDVVITTRKGFYRVASSVRHPDRPSHLRVRNQPTLSSNRMINYFSRKNYPLWMQLTVSRFPLIFLDPNPCIFEHPTPDIAAIDKGDRVNLRCGLEVREGFAGLVEEIAGSGTELVTVLRESGLQTDAWIHSRIVKSKMGLLVWSGDTNLKEPFRTLFSGYVASVCHRSSRVCEDCGKYGKLREINGWKETLCDQDYARRSKPGRTTRK